MSMKLEKKNREDQKRSRLVEIVGPAGAGKTTLCQVLSSCHGIHLNNFPDVRKARNAPFFFLYGLQAFPIFLQTLRFTDRRLSRREIAWLSILSGWPKILRDELRRSEDVIVLDQGPVYLLSEMNLFGPEFLKADQARKVWQTWYCQWAAVLDTIVWLDAADECLINRIHRREKDHVVKDAAPEEVIKFLGSYRNVYERTFSRLIGHRNGIKILQFDTNRQLPEEIANQLLVEWNLKTATRAD